MNNEKTNDEINRMITERLFPEDCCHDWTGDYEYGDGGERVTQCRKCGEWSYDNNLTDFCNSDSDIRAARERIAEKGLQVQFINALEKEVLKTRHSAGAFYLMQSSPEVQARAICRVLEGLKDE